MFTFPLLLTIYAGFIHAFETDHLLAVTNIVSQRNNIKLSMKDGVFWGLGHASTIFFIGVLMILFKVAIPQHNFHYFEATVGVMLIALAVYRLTKFFSGKKLTIHSHAHTHEGDNAQHKHLHVHLGKEDAHTNHHTHAHKHSHKLAYGVGLVHGLAGSGVLVLAAMTQIKSPVAGVTYLAIFGGACVFGMMFAAGLFSVPFSKKIIQGQTLQNALIIITSILCLLYGSKVIFENLMA